MKTDNGQTSPPGTGAHSGTWARLALWLLILWAAMQLGGGFYEKRVVIPMWSVNPTPQTLGQALDASGHTRSGTQFWPYISPVVFLLAIINVVVAWHHVGPARQWWLGGSLGFLAMSISTYSYFVPTMLSLMHRAETYESGQLATTVQMWLFLSQIRMIIPIPAWLASVKALTLLGGRQGLRP